MLDRWWLALGAGLLLLAVAAGAAGAVPAGAQTEVKISALGPPPRFEPATMTVPVGTSVTWEVLGGTHSSTSVDGLWDSGVGGAGTTVSYTFTQPGTYQYFCIPHREVGMVGTVTVVAASSAQTPSVLPRTGELPLAAGAALAGLLGFTSLGAGLAVRRRRPRV